MQCGTKVASRTSKAQEKGTSPQNAPGGAPIPRRFTERRTTTRKHPSSQTKETNTQKENKPTQHSSMTPKTRSNLQRPSPHGGRTKIKYQGKKNFI